MDSHATIYFDVTGFSVPEAEGVMVPWSSIRRISAFKRDLLTTDEVFLLFENDTAPEYIEVSEEESGFGEFILEIERRFSFSAGWWEAVLKPVFTRNELVLYARTDAQPGA